MGKTPPGLAAALAVSLGAQAELPDAARYARLVKDIGLKLD